MSELLDRLMRRLTRAESAGDAVGDAVGRSIGKRGPAELAALVDRHRSLLTQLGILERRRPAGGATPQDVAEWQESVDNVRSQFAEVDSEIARARQFNPTLFGHQVFTEDPARAIPESVQSATRAAASPDTGTGPAVTARAAWDADVRQPGMSGRLRAAILKNKAARSQNVPFRPLADAIRDAIQAATPVTVESAPNLLQAGQFGALMDPSVRELLSRPDAQNALLTLASDLGVPVGSEADLAGAIIRRIAENTQAAARSGAAARPASRAPRMGSTDTPAESHPARPELGITDTGARPGVYGGPENFEALQVSPPAVVGYMPAVSAVTGDPKLSYVTDPATGEPVPDGGVIPAIQPGTTNAPDITEEIRRQVLENGMDYAGLGTQQPPPGIFAGRVFKDADGNLQVEPDYNRPAIQLVKRRGGGDGSRAPEAVEFLLPVGDGTFQRITPTGGGRQEILTDLDVQRLLYQGFEPQGSELDALRPVVETPEAIGRRILEASLSRGATDRQAAQSILSQYEALRRIGGQEAADQALEEAGSVLPSRRTELEAQLKTALEAGRELDARAIQSQIENLPPDRLEALSQIASPPADVPRQRGVRAAVQINRDMAIPSTAVENAGLPELSRQVTQPRPGVYDVQATTGDTGAAAVSRKLQEARRAAAAGDVLPESQLETQDTDMRELVRLMRSQGDSLYVVGDDGVTRLHPEVMQLALRITDASAPTGGWSSAKERAAKLGAVLKDAQSASPALAQRDRQVARASRAADTAAAALGGSADVAARSAPGTSGASVVSGLLPNGRKPRKGTRRGSVAASTGGQSIGGGQSGEVFDPAGDETDILARSGMQEAEGSVSAEPVSETVDAGFVRGDGFTMRPSNTVDAVWKNADFDQPVTIYGLAGTFNGERYFKVAGSQSAIPESQLEFSARGDRTKFDRPGPADEMRFDGARSGRIDPAMLQRALAQFVVSPDSWAAGISPPAAELARMLQGVRMNVRAGGIADLPPGFRRTTDAIQSHSMPNTAFTQPALTSVDTGARPAMTQADVGAGMRGSMTLNQVRPEPPPLAEMERFFASSLNGYLTQERLSGILDELNRLGKPPTPANILDEGRLLYAAETGRTGFVGDETDPASQVVVNDAAQRAREADMEEWSSTAAFIDANRAAADPARDWTSADTLRQLFKMHVNAQLEPKVAQLQELKARARAGDAEAAAEAEALEASINRFRSQTYPLGLQEPESRPKEMREPSRAEVDAFERAAAREALLREKLNVGVPEEQRAALEKAVYEAGQARMTAMRRLSSPDFDMVEESTAAAADRHFQTLLGGGNDRAPATRAPGSAEDDYAGADDEFDLKGMVEEGADNSTRAVRKPQAAAMSADTALQELLRSDAGDARAVIEGIVQASERAGLPMTAEQVVYSMLKNYRGAGTPSPTGMAAERMQRLASTESGGATFSDSALRDLAQRSWEDIQRMSPKAAPPSAAVGEYTTAQQVMRAPGRIRQAAGWLSQFLRPGPLETPAPKPDAPMPQDAAFAMLPDPEAISPSDMPGVAMPADLARSRLSQLAVVEQRMAQLEASGIDTSALRMRAQNVRDAIATQLRSGLVPQRRQPDLSRPTGTDVDPALTEEDLADAARVAEEGLTPEEAAATREATIKVEADQAARPPKPEKPALGKLRSGDYLPTAGLHFAVPKDQVATLLEAARNSDAGIPMDSDPDFDTSNPTVFGYVRPRGQQSFISIERSSGESPLIGQVPARQIDWEGGEIPEGGTDAVIRFNDEGLPEVVSEGPVKTKDLRGKPVDFDSGPVDLSQPRRSGNRYPQIAAIEEPVDHERQAARRAAERQAAAEAEAGEIRQGARGNAQGGPASAVVAGAAAPRASAGAPGEVTPLQKQIQDALEANNRRELAAARAKEEADAAAQTAPAAGGSRVGRIAKRGAVGLVAAGAGMYGIQEAQKAGILPTNKELLLASMAPGMMAMVGGGGYAERPAGGGDTKEAAEPVVSRIRRARSEPYFTLFNMLPR